MPLAHSKVLNMMAGKAFKDCDLDNSGTIDAKELHVGILLVYDKLNNALPIKINPPEHSEIKSILKRFDYDQNGTLNKEEFVACVNNLVGNTTDKHSIFDSMPARIAQKHILKMLVIPFAVLCLKGLVKKALKTEVVNNVPDPILGFGVEGLVKAGSAAILSRRE